MRTVFQVRKFDGEKYLPRAENKLSNLEEKYNEFPMCSLEEHLHFQEKS